MPQARSSADTAVERFQKRIVEMLQVGWTGFHFTPGDKWHSMDIEEKCSALLGMWDAERVETGPARSTKEPTDVREFVKQFTDEPQPSAVSDGLTDDQIKYAHELAEERRQAWVDAALAVIRSRWNFEENEFDAIEKVLLDPECAAVIRDQPQAAALGKAKTKYI